MKKLLLVLTAVLLLLCGCNISTTAGVDPLNFAREDDIISCEHLRFTVPEGYRTVKYGNRYNAVVDVVEGYLAYTSQNMVHADADCAGVQLCLNKKPFDSITDADYRAAVEGEKYTVTDFSVQRTTVNGRQVAYVEATSYYTAGLENVSIYCVQKRCDIDIGNNESLTFWVRSFGDSRVQLAAELEACFDSLEILAPTSSEVSVQQ